MKLILLALAWLVALLILLFAVIYGLYRAKHIEFSSRFTLSYIANFVTRGQTKGSDPLNPFFVC